MGLFDFIKGEFIEVVHWEDSTQDTMVHKFPMTSKQQIKEGAQLIVRPSQVAIFVYEGQIADVYEAGKYTLNTDTTPILTTLSNWKHLFENHFKTDVYFVNTKQFTNQKWGTTNPIMMRDQDFGMLRLRGYGVYAFKVENPVSFLKEVFGSNKFYTVDQITEHLKSIIVSLTSDAIAESKIPAMDLSMNLMEIAALTTKAIHERFGVFGLGISDFIIENLSLPESVEKAIDKRTEMGAIGDMNQYMKYQSAEAIRDAAQNTGGGMASMGAGIGAGMGIGQMMKEAMSPQDGISASSAQGSQSPQAPQANSVPCASCGKPNVQGAKFCVECGQSFMKKCVSCGKDLDAGAKFCMECGANQTVKTACVACGEPLEAGAKFCPACGGKQE